MRDEERKQKHSGGSKWQRYLRKKWVFPAIYIASAAIVLTSVLWFQSNSGNEVKAPDDSQRYSSNEKGQYATHDTNQEAVPVSLTQETIQMPVHDEEEVIIQKEFYSYDASPDEQQAALVFYNNTYYQNKGIDIAKENGESFDVVASLSGTVIKSEKDQLLGNVVHIEHENNITTRYSSLEDVHVEVGESIEQGTVIGKAGRSVFNKDAGVHVHFEIRENNVPVDPVKYIDQPLANLLDEENSSEKPEEKDNSSKQQDDQVTNEKQEEQKPENDKSTEKEPTNDKQQLDDLEKDASISMTRT